MPFGVTLRLVDSDSAPPSVPAETKGVGAFPTRNLLPTLGGMPTASSMRVSQATSLQVSTVFACCRIRARDLARCTPRVLRDDGRGTKTEVTDHPLATLFRKPNSVQGWFAFAEQLHVAFMLWSNAYALILRDWRGTPTELIPVNPDLVTPMEAPDGSLFYTVSAAGLWLAAMLETMHVVIPAENMLHIRDLTFNTLVGVSRIALARDAIGLAMVQEQQAARWAANGARPAGVPQSAKTLSQEAADRLRQQWSNLQEGIQNTARTAILEDGLEWKQMALSSVDLEFISARLVQVKEIARFFEVPLHKLGENEALQRATAGQLDAEYVQSTVMGDCVRWEQTLARTFEALLGGLSIKLDERELMRADFPTMVNAARAGVLSGLLTQNEGRAYLGGYGPLPGGDVLRAPVNLAPNGSDLDGIAPDGAGRPPSAQLPGGAKRAASFNPDQPRDDHGRWTSGGDDGGGLDSEGLQHVHDACARDEDCSALDHEVKLVLKGLAIVSAGAILTAVLPEALAGSAIVAGGVAMAGKLADQMFTTAGVMAATHALKGMGVDTSEAEDVLRTIEQITKSVDAHGAKLLQRLIPKLRGAAFYAREVAVTKMKAQHPELPQEIVGAVDQARVLPLKDRTIQCGRGCFPGVIWRQTIARSMAS